MHEIVWDGNVVDDIAVDEIRVCSEFADDIHIGLFYVERLLTQVSFANAILRCTEHNTSLVCLNTSLLCPNTSVLRQKTSLWC